MGVMSCARSGCDSIMCDTYISEVGYVCYSCQREFEKHMGSIVVGTEYEMAEFLKNFMQTSKSETGSCSTGLSISEFFRKHTRD